MAYAFEALRGVKGYVKDEDGNPVKGAKLVVGGREERPFNTTSLGEYWRILLNGTYTLLVNNESISCQFFNADRYVATASPRTIFTSSYGADFVADCQLADQSFDPIICIIDSNRWRVIADASSICFECIKYRCIRDGDDD